jgi:hypothetical protein
LPSGFSGADGQQRNGRRLRIGHGHGKMIGGEHRLSFENSGILSKQRRGDLGPPGWVHRYVSDWKSSKSGLPLEESSPLWSRCSPPVCSPKELNAKPTLI